MLGLMLTSAVLKAQPPMTDLASLALRHGSGLLDATTQILPPCYVAGGPAIAITRTALRPPDGVGLLSRIAYVNGRYLPHRSAKVAIDDRGYQFADGVYEVIEVRHGALVDEAAHLARLERSLGELAIAWPMTASALGLVMREVVGRNRVTEGMVYLQISRGVAPRDHVYPEPGVRPALVVTATATDPVKAAAKAAAGIRVITMPDLRWKRPDIKSTSLLPNVMAKAAAKARGAGEAWLVTANGMVSEGAASNAWIVQGERVVTHPGGVNAILEGITRRTLLAVLADTGLVLDERPFSVQEAYRAREAFTTGATSLVLPVVAIDDRPIADGRPGPIATTLRARFHAFAHHTPVRTARPHPARPLAAKPADALVQPT